MTGVAVELLDIELVFPGPPCATVLRSVDLVIRDGTSLAVMGPSGAGKSSLASVIGWLQPATSGVYRYKGTDVSHLSPSSAADFRRRTVGFVFQSANLIDERTAWANVALGWVHDASSRAEIEDSARLMLGRVGLSSVADRPAGLLSGGERQRVAVARAALKRPSLLIADEPTASLDQQNGQAVLELLSELAHGTSTLILVTHDHRAAAITEESVEMVDGRIVA